jgi:hypothetical protein
VSIEYKTVNPAGRNEAQSLPYGQPSDKIRTLTEPNLHGRGKVEKIHLLLQAEIICLTSLGKKSPVAFITILAFPQSSVRFEIAPLM